MSFAEGLRSSVEGGLKGGKGDGNCSARNWGQFKDPRSVLEECPTRAFRKSGPEELHRSGVIKGWVFDLGVLHLTNGGEKGVNKC